MAGAATEAADSRQIVRRHTHTLVHLHHRHLCCFAFSRDSHVGYLIKRSSLVAPPQSHQCDAPVSPVYACVCVLQLHQVTSTLTHDLVVPPRVRNPFLNENIKLVLWSPGGRRHVNGSGKKINKQQSAVCVTRSVATCCNNELRAAKH